MTPKTKTGSAGCRPVVLVGAPDTIRTYDTRVRRAVLYPLSYRGTQGRSIAHHCPACLAGAADDPACVSPEQTIRAIEPGFTAVTNGDRPPFDWGQAPRMNGDGPRARMGTGLNGDGPRARAGTGPMRDRGQAPSPLTGTGPVSDRGQAPPQVSSPNGDRPRARMETGPRGATSTLAGATINTSET